MSDREKVIKGLEEISDYFFSVYHHAKDREEIIEAKDRCDAVENALALLKEQDEPIKPNAERKDMPEIEATTITASDNGIAVGAIHGGITINRTYNQTANEVYNIGHLERMDG